MKRDPADLSTAETARELGVLPGYVHTLVRRAGVWGQTYRAGHRRYYTPAAIQSMRAWRQERGRAARGRINVAVDTATLRHWWLEERYATGVVARRCSISHGTLPALLCERGIPTNRPRGPLRCGCGQLLNGSHPRCPRCGLLICSYNPEHGPGPLCVACQRDLAALAPRRRQGPGHQRRPLGAIGASCITTRT